MEGKIQVKWDPKNFEIRSRAVEAQLRPLIDHVTTLVNSDKPTKKKRGKSKKGAVILAALEKAITNFIEHGEQIAIENPDMTENMLAVVNEIRREGVEMSSASQVFLSDPCNSQKRSEMVKAARVLLTAVTRLLILADMIDVQLLLENIHAVEASLEKLRTESNRDQLMDELQNYHKYAKQLLNESGKRQQNLNDPNIRDELAAARAVLKKRSTMLMSASKSYISHPNLPAAVENKDQILKQLCEAVDTISTITQGKRLQDRPYNEGPGRIAVNLETLETSKNLDYTEVRTKTLLEQQLEELVNGVTLISESATISDERKNKIVSGATALREALQNLLIQSMSKPTEKGDGTLDDISRKTKILKRQLGKAVADEVSDSFHDTEKPLLDLVAAAESGDTKQVETRAVIFKEHCNKLIEVADHVCQLSTNEEGVKMVRFAAHQLPDLCTGVINAARILAVDPQNTTNQENMAAYKKAWEDQVWILLQAVDDITTIDDVLSVLDQHMLEEMNKYIEAVETRNPEKMRGVVEDIRRRTMRICDVVNNEMDNYEPCMYTMKVLQAVKMLNEDIEKFNTKTEKIIKSMEENQDQEIEYNEYIDATRIIYDGVRDIRRAVLMNRADDDLDPEDVEFEETNTNLISETTETTTTTTTIEENLEDVSGITVARNAINKLPEEEKTRIMEQVKNFQSEKLTFDKEVAKWDEADNDIIALAKYMCMIMIQMTDFIRQRGPLKTIVDVIQAAKKISETGVKFKKLTQQIAENCPESSTKNDLEAYTERVTLYSHQINMVAKVKSDVENNSNEELLHAGLENAMSLIENAKNLMNAVVLTVKASYIASSRYNRQGPLPSAVVWKMKAPEKKPLVGLAQRKEVRAVVRKGSQRKPQNPIKVLADFEVI